VNKPPELRANEVIQCFPSVLTAIPCFIEEKPAHEAEKDELDEELCPLVCVEYTVQQNLAGTCSATSHGIVPSRRVRDILQRFAMVLESYSETSSDF
jgi:hypothetical protein